MRKVVVWTSLLLTLAGSVQAQERSNSLLIPILDGQWWQVAGNPDLGRYTSEDQEPVDFAVWQAADGTWQLWSCIRKTRCGGNTRLFHRWEGTDLTDSNWKAMGIAMEGDPAYGEAIGGLQAPHVFKEHGTYYMFYGDWKRICLAKSGDGKNFTRVLNDRGQPDLFTGPYTNTRDAMVLKHNGTYYCYYTGHKADAVHKAAVFCRTSEDMLSWSQPFKVSAGGVATKLAGPYLWGSDSECPFVIKKDGQFYLFRNQRYGDGNINLQYLSPDPLNFGIDDDSLLVSALPVAAPEIILHNDSYYIAALMPDLQGIRISKLKWVPARNR